MLSSSSVRVAVGWGAGGRGGGKEVRMAGTTGAIMPCGEMGEADRDEVVDNKG